MSSSDWLVIEFVQWASENSKAVETWKLQTCVVTFGGFYIASDAFPITQVIWSTVNIFILQLGHTEMNRWCVVQIHEPMALFKNQIYCFLSFSPSVSLLFPLDSTLNWLQQLQITSTGNTIMSSLADTHNAVHITRGNTHTCTADEVRILKLFPFFLPVKQELPAAINHDILCRAHY